MKVGTIFSGLAGVGIIALIAVGIICGVQLDGKIFIGFDQFTIQAKYKKHSVRWCYRDEDRTLIELEKDEDLESGDIAYFDSNLPSIDGYVFKGFSNADQDEDTRDWYTTVKNANVTCMAIFEALED